MNSIASGVRNAKSSPQYQKTLPSMAMTDSKKAQLAVQQKGTWQSTRLV
jgi:hypothetical protein